MVAHKTFGQEDCLVVNVYTPSLRSMGRGPLPVMVFIHGGAFYFWSGTNDLFGPERFMDYDVVSEINELECWFKSFCNLLFKKCLTFLDCIFSSLHNLFLKLFYVRWFIFNFKWLKIILKKVLVTLNYRLGPLGFMSTSDDVIPGNFGLWDQRLALQWVQKNILDYGGDPNQVSFL